MIGSIIGRSPWVQNLFWTCLIDISDKSLTSQDNCLAIFSVLPFRFCSFIECWNLQVRLLYVSIKQAYFWLYSWIRCSVIKVPLLFCDSFYILAGFFFSVNHFFIFFSGIFQKICSLLSSLLSGLRARSAYGFLSLKAPASLSASVFTCPLTASIGYHRRKLLSTDIFNIFYIFYFISTIFYLYIQFI